MLSQKLFIKSCSVFNNFKNINLLRTKSYPANILHRNKTVESIYNYWKLKFDYNQISEPSNSIGYIIAHVFQTENISEVYKRFSSVLSSTEINEINKLCELRLQRMPIQYVIGEWNFYGLILKMQAPVFIPRPETEELINVILKHVKNNDNILEICCGSGAISLALLKSNSSIKITAIDQSIGACILTQENARIHKFDKRLNVMHYKLTCNSRLQELNEKFDIIVSNPPYVPSEDVRKVQPEIKLYEDLLALDGGKDGLDIIKPILKLASEKLVIGGKLFIETDTSHPKLICQLVNNSKMRLKYLNTFKDFCMKDRFVLIEKY